MTVLYLPDTSILIHLVRRDAVGLRIQTLYDPLMTEARPIISVVTVGELRSLAYQFKWGKAKRDKALFLLNYSRRITIDDDPDITEAYAVIDAYSEGIGCAMGKNDLWIAATANATGATILTTDKEFDHLSPHFVSRLWIDPQSDRPATE